jgi:lipopolysaccharide export system permease protein
LREIYKPLPVLLIILLVITISFSSVVYLSDATSGIIPSDAVVKLIFLKALDIFMRFFPLMVYLTVIIGLGRLYSDHEITALRSMGLNNSTVIRSLIVSFLLLAILVAFFSHIGRPMAFQSRYALLQETKNTLTQGPLKSGQFYESSLNNVYFVEQFINKTNEAEGVFVRAAEGDVTRLIYADKGYLDTGKDNEYFSMHFSNGHAYTFDLNNNFSVKLAFNHLEINLEQITPEVLSFKRRAASTVLLRKSSVPEDIAEFQTRFTTPLKLVLLAMLAVFLSKTAPRKGKYGKLVLAIVIYFVYDNLEILNLYAIEHGYIGIFPGMSLVLLFPIALLLLFVFTSSKA